MAKSQKTTGKSSTGTSFNDDVSASRRSRAKPGPQEHAERLSKTLSESAQQIWLAGVGAFSRAQGEGTRLFETMVREGLNVEQTARKFAGTRADGARTAVQSGVGQARERAVQTWDRVENVFEDRVHRALVKLDVPGREDIALLNRRIEALTAELRRQPRSAASKPAAKARKKATGTVGKVASKSPKKAEKKTRVRKTVR